MKGGHSHVRVTLRGENLQNVRRATRSYINHWCRSRQSCQGHGFSLRVTAINSSLFCTFSIGFINSMDKTVPPKDLLKRQFPLTRTHTFFNLTSPFCLLFWVAKIRPSLPFSWMRYETLFSSLKCNADDQLSGTVPSNQSSSLAGSVGLFFFPSTFAHMHRGFFTHRRPLSTEDTVRRRWRCRMSAA